MSRGTGALIAGLALVYLALIVLMAMFVSFASIKPEDSDRLDVQEAIWGVLMHALNTGTMVADKGWQFRLIMLIITFGGIFSISALVGIVSNGIETKLEELRKGRSRVIETNHIVILGWSLKIFTLISELALANAHQPNTCIVILSEEDKVQMEDTLRDQVGKLPRIRLVCRTGSSSDIADLSMVNIQAARTILILNRLNDRDDIQLVKTLLVIANIPRSVPQPYHIVTEAQNSKTLDVIDIVAPNQVEVVLAKDLIPRIIVQTSQQRGLSRIYMELMDFDGNEIYFKKEPTLQGSTYGEVLLAYNDSAVIGIKRSDDTIQLNPPIDRQLQAGEELIVISEDIDKIRISDISQSLIDRQAIHIQKLVTENAKNTLILGWSNHIPAIIQQMDCYVLPGSTVTVVTNFPEAEVTLSLESLSIQRQTVHYRQGDITARQVLEDLNLNEYQQVIVLCNPNIDPEQADAQTLVTLLYLRDITERNNYNLQIISEMLDVRNQTIAQMARPNDFILSEYLIAQILAQVAHQKYLNAVFADLFDPEGSEIYLKPVSNYVTLAHAVNFYTVVEAAKQQGESAIGYCCQADANKMEKAYGIVINPKKDRAITFAPHDTIIVLAES